MSLQVVMVTPRTSATTRTLWVVLKVRRALAAEMGLWGKMMAPWMEAALTRVRLAAQNAIPGTMIAAQRTRSTTLMRTMSLCLRKMPLTCPL